MTDTTKKSDPPSARYAAMCSSGVWTAAIMVWLLLAVNHGVFLIPGFLPVFLVGLTSGLAGAVGYGYGKLVESMSGAATGNINAVDLPLGPAIIVGFLASVPGWLLNIFLCETFFTPYGPMLPYMVVGAVQAVVSIACILLAWTLHRFSHAQGKPRRFLLAQVILWPVGIVGPSVLLLVVIGAYSVYHDWRHSQYKPELGRYRQIARETVYEKIKGAQAGMYGPRAVKPKLLVVTVTGWVDDGVQSQIGSEGAANAREVGTLVYLQRYQNTSSSHRLYFVDPASERVLNIVETSDDDSGIVEYLKLVSKGQASATP